MIDYIIVYKSGPSIEDKLQQIKLSHLRPYQLIYTDSDETLKTALKKYPNSLLYFFTEHLDQADRVKLKNISLAIPNMDICLCGAGKYALDAWKLDVFHFLATPITESSMVTGYRKYLNLHNKNKKEELNLKTNDGLVKVPFKSICFIKAAGNYSTIYTAGNKSFVQTKQLQAYEPICEADTSISRVHRSLILNTHRVKKVGDAKLYFYELDKPLQISKALESKIKRLLLGK